MRNILIAIIGIAMLGAGYYWGTMQRTDAPRAENTRQEETTNQPSENTGRTFPEGAVMEDGTIDEPVSDPVYDALITFTDDGYSPSLVTIKKGQTVRFVNNAKDETWPASAVHPTHSLYPEKTDSDCLGSAFDACRGLKPGEFWEFTFNHTGTWRYHDHLKAYRTGSVIVE